jgi:hypothetical protein
MPSLEQVFDSLAAWCRARDYAGHDPFDALNSRLFQSTPLARSRLARLAWTQAFKRSPVNLRRLARVPAQRNAKGTALFALAWLARARTGDVKGDVRDEARREAATLLDDLTDARIETARGVAWGYNFDWQGRAFFAPKGTPTVVPTAFAVRALAEASHDLSGASSPASVGGRGADYLNLARAACEFILRELNRSDETPGEFCFSYTPFDRTRVFNASLLAAEALAAVGALTNEDELKREAVRAARYVVRRQREDGSWAYGAEGFQTWSDNFHTAFVLSSLARIVDNCEDCREEFSTALLRGFDFWRARFFRADGFPKFTPTRDYPADAHSAGAALVALADVRALSNDALTLAEKIARWSVENLFDARGFFHYQLRRTHRVRTPYMRWSQGWMMCGLARHLEMMNAK